MRDYQKPFIELRDFGIFENVSADSGDQDISIFDPIPTPIPTPTPTCPNNRKHVNNGCKHCPMYLGKNMPCAAGKSPK